MTSWRDSVTVHPLADSFPLMSDGELQELAADIKKNGQRDPVLFATIDGKKVLIDGRNRLAACFLAKQEPVSETVDFRDEAAIETFIRSRNVYRRHLTPAERAAALRDRIKTGPEKSDRQLATEAGVDHKTIGAVRKRLETAGEISPTAKRTGRDRKQYKATKAPVPHKDESAFTNAGANIADGIAAAINGFAAATPEVSAEKRKAQYAMLEATETDVATPVEQVAHTPALTIPLHAELADIARQIIDAFGGERAASIAGEILRATTPKGIPEKDEVALKRARGRPPGSKNKPKADNAPKLEAADLSIPDYLQR